ncbi:MAG: helix-turn-helix transcriptional regulator [Cyanobacteria bacterium P01_A01_bin.84]
MRFKLREVRETKGFTRQEIAEYCGVSLSTIQDYENDTRKQFSRELIVKFCELLECTPNDLFVLEPVAA